MVSPGHSLWGPSQPSIRETLGRGTPLLPRGNSGSLVGGTRCGSPVEGAGPSPAATRTPEAAALEAFLSGVGSSDGGATCPRLPARARPQVNRRASLGWASPAHGRPGTGLGA